MASPNSTLPNDEKEAQDSHYNPGEQAYQEGMGTGVGAGIDQAEAFANDPANHDDAKDVRDAEEDGDGDWNNRVSSDYGGNKAKSGKGISRANFQAVLKKRGPIAAIVTLVFGGSIGVGLFFGPSLLLLQIQDAVLGKYDSQNTSMTIRADRILANKITGDSTSGSCDFVQIACRFSRPSNKLLKNLEANGVTAYDKDGKLIERKGLFQGTRPAKYVFGGKEILAKDFYKELRSNALFRAAFHRAYNPKFAAFSDFVFKGIKSRFGFDTADKDGDKAKNATENLNDTSKGANALAGEAEEGTEDVIKKLISAEAGATLSKIAQGGKGDAIGLVAASVCATADVPQLITKTVRAYQLAQLITYGMKFLTVGSKLKAGSLSPAEASSFGSLLTNVVGGKSAMDSFGMQYTMFGATKATTSGYKAFSPGANAIGALGGITQVMSSGAKKDICNAAVNPATGQAINAALALNAGETLGATLIVAAINIGAGYALSAVIEHFVVPLVAEAMKGIDFKPLLGFFLGDLTQNLVGEAVGDAGISGMSNALSQTANAGGNMPLTVADAIAYNGKTQEVNLAYAEEDKASLSPFDATNKNTFVGSFVSGLTPYLSKMGSITGIFSSLASIPSGSLASLTSMSTTHATAATEADYSLCEDPAINDAGVAAGPFCNIQYGIPTHYLDMDPQAIVESLVASGDVNPVTGDPIDKGDGESLYRWVTTCTDGATDQLKNCQIVDDQTAMYSVYTIDHRIQKGMDEEEGDDSLSLDKKSLAAKIVAKNKVSYLGDVQPKLDDIASGAVDPDAEPCGININILKAIDVITDSHSIKISDINRHCTSSTAGGTSSTSSRHYAGNGSALDIAVIDGVALQGRDPTSISIINLIMPILSAAATVTPGQTSSYGQAQCGPSITPGQGVKTFNDFCTHVHVDVPPGSDPNLKHS